MELQYNHSKKKKKAERESKLKNRINFIGAF